MDLCFRTMKKKSIGAASLKCVYCLQRVCSVLQSQADWEAGIMTGLANISAATTHKALFQGLSSLSTQFTRVADLSVTEGSSGDSHSTIRR